MTGAMLSGAGQPAARGSITSKLHVNKVQLGGPGEEEHLADFFEYGEGDGNSTWPFGIAIDDERDRVYCSDEWTNTISVFDSSGKFIEKWGATGSADGELLRPAGIAVEKNGNVIVVDSGNNRLQVFSLEGKFISTSPTGRTIASRNCRLPASA